MLLLEHSYRLRLRANALADLQLTTLLVHTTKVGIGYSMRYLAVQSVSSSGGTTFSTLMLKERDANGGTITSPFMVLSPSFP